LADLDRHNSEHDGAGKGEGERPRRRLVNSLAIELITLRVAIQKNDTTLATPAVRREAKALARIEAGGS